MGNNEKPEGKPQMDVGDFFKQLSGDKLATIQEVIDELKKAISERQQLQKIIFNDLEGTKMSISNMLLKTAEMTPEEEAELRKKLIDLDMMRTQEKLDCWRDCAQLQHELREHLREQREAVKKFDMLDGML